MNFYLHIPRYEIYNKLTINRLRAFSHFATIPNLDNTFNPYLTAD